MSKYRIFVFSFFKNYSWKYVIIDDRLPCYESHEPTLVFAHSRDRSEFWVALVEKAYAKLHGCYESLISGFIDDGLNDMTGFVSEKLKLRDKKGLSVTEDEFWTKLKAFKDNGCMMGCSITGEGVEHEVVMDGDKTGLLAGHAYSILDVILLPPCEIDEEERRLVRIRNPWGSKEWNGAWSDGDEVLLRNEKRLIK